MEHTNHTETNPMKRLILALLAATLLLPRPVEARPVRAVLVVQNNAGDEFSKPLANIATRLRSQLPKEKFGIVIPTDRVVGKAAMEQASSVNQALNLEGELLIEASIDEASVDTIGTPGPRQRQFAQMTMTVSAMQLPLGESVASGTFTAKSDSVPTEMLSARADALYNQAVQRLVDGAAKAFLADCDAVDWSAVSVPEYVTVGFGCNLPGANVLLDGLSRGTAGGPGSPVLRVRTWSGTHHVRIESDFMIPFETEALLEDGTSFLAVLKENDEGRQRRKEDRHFDILMDRIEKAGATDDTVRTLRAEGYSKYLSSSYTRIEGMPQILNAHDFNPDFGLGSAADDDTGESTEAYVRELGASIGLPASTPEATSERAEDTETPSGGARSPREPSDDDDDDESSVSASASASASVNAVRPFPDEQMVVATAAPAAVAAVGGTASGRADSSASASSGPTVADTLDTLNSGASIAKSILHIWNMVH